MHDFIYCFKYHVLNAAYATSCLQKLMTYVCLLVCSPIMKLQVLL